MVTKDYRNKWMEKIKNGRKDGEHRLGLLFPPVQITFNKVKFVKYMVCIVTYLDYIYANMHKAIN